MKKTLLFLFACLPALLFAQVKDAGLWLNTTAQYNFSLELVGEIGEELRFNENLSELGTHFTDIGISYKILKGKLKPGFHYRFSNKRQLDDSYSKRHRWYVDLAFRQKAAILDISIRTRYQSQYADVFSSDDGMVPSLTWRNKLVVKLDMEKKWIPYISTELFTDIRARVNNNVRYALGLDYEINKLHELGLYFMHQREFNVNDPYFDYIWGINYTIAIDYLFGGTEQ